MIEIVLLMASISLGMGMALFYRVKATEAYVKAVEDHLWMVNDKVELINSVVSIQCSQEVVELPETDTETVREAIK